MSSSTWDKVMAYKSADKRHVGIANDLTEYERQPIYGVIDFFATTERWQENIFDLKVAKYRIFDWLAMRVQGRGDELPTKVLVYSFLKSEGDIDKWIEDLRFTDYEIVDDWRKVEL